MIKLWVLIFALVFGGTYLFAGQYDNITIDLPEGWTIHGSIISDTNGRKIGELYPPKYTSSNKFIEAYMQGFPDDDSRTKFIESGELNGVTWICRSSPASDGKGNEITWYPRVFWKEALEVRYVSYSRIDCNESLLEASYIVNSITLENK